MAEDAGPEVLPLSQVADITAERAGLVLRLAQGTDEIRACQELRFQVFYEELSAKPDAVTLAAQRDEDRFDAFCDHLVVVSPEGRRGARSIGIGGGELVGTYRLLRQEAAVINGGFYTEAEFDVAPMIASHPDLRFLELGRSCVLKPFRTQPAAELLWQGIWNYVRALGLDVMFGCASLEGADPAIHRDALAYLARRHRAPSQWRVSAWPQNRVDMVASTGADAKAALRALPPLIKGYLRLGCYVGDGAVTDRQFNTTDILVVLPVSAISPRYFSHFGEPTG